MRKLKHPQLIEASTANVLRLCRYLGCPEKYLNEEDCRQWLVFKGFAEAKPSGVYG